MPFTNEDVRIKIVQLLRLRPEQVSPESVLRTLVRDSFALVELVITLQQHFDIVLRQQDLDGIATIDDLTRTVVSKQT